MRKKLIAAIVVIAVLVGCAVGAVIFMEGYNKPGQQEQTEPNASTGETAASQETNGAEDATQEPTEETVGISLPTEDPNDVTPEVTLDPDATIPDVTVDPDATQDPDATEDPEENAMPDMDF